MGNEGIALAWYYVLYTLFAYGVYVLYPFTSKKIIEFIGLGLECFRITKYTEMRSTQNLLQSWKSDCLCISRHSLRLLRPGTGLMMVIISPASMPGLWLRWDVQNQLIFSFKSNQNFLWTLDPNPLSLKTLNSKPWIWAFKNIQECCICHSSCLFWWSIVCSCVIYTLPHICSWVTPILLYAGSWASAQSFVTTAIGFRFEINFYVSIHW